MELTNDGDAIERVVEALSDGSVAVVPTDTVYGLAADPRSAVAMARLFELKERPEGVPIAVLVGSVDQARSLIEWSDTIETLAAEHWPGALTIVGRALDGDLHLGSLDTIGVRLPDHALIQAVAERFGPIGCTSANRHKQPTIVDPAELSVAFGADVEVIVDGGMLDGTASTVVDVTVDPPAILRQGMVRLDHLD